MIFCHSHPFANINKRAFLTRITKSMSQVVDTESAHEFMKETIARVSEDELNTICTALEAKSAFFQTTLAKGKVECLSDEKLKTVFKNIFATRRSFDKLLKMVPEPGLAVLVNQLLYGGEAVELRFQHFCEALPGWPINVRYDVASELLHFTFPDQYWLWTRWMWDPKTKTGALTLVTTEDYDLTCETLREGYLRVGQSVAFVHQVGEAAGFIKLKRGLFGTDVYLACVYVIYVYTVLRLRMTQEFNKVVPGLPEFSRRLLGVYNKEA